MNVVKHSYDDNLLLCVLDLSFFHLNAACDHLAACTRAVDDVKIRCTCEKNVHISLIHDLLFLPISTIESAVGKRLITHCCVSRLACSRLSGHIEPHSPDFKREINTTTTVMNNNTTVYWNTLATLVYSIVDCGVTMT